MDFARKQLEKYGWSDGKGLGKHENGISEALKPKLKRSVTGIGHDPASEFNEHWWSALYDKAAKNVEVEDKNGKTKKIKTKDSGEFVITSSTWRINKKRSKETDEREYSEYFVRTAVLTNDKGGRKTENVKSESEDESEKKDVFKMTDEELFAACEGRTAHKGARHGLRALGKLARIAEQEQMLLTQPQYQGYSHAKKLKQKEDIVEQMTLLEEVPEVQKKKKKRKRCDNDRSVEPEISLAELSKSGVTIENENEDDNIRKKNQKLKRNNTEKLVESDSTLPELLKTTGRVTTENKNEDDQVRRKNKKLKQNNTDKLVESDSTLQELLKSKVGVTIENRNSDDEVMTVCNEDLDDSGIAKKSKKRKVDDNQTETEITTVSESKIKKKKKKKVKHEQMDC